MNVATFVPLSAAYNTDPSINKCFSFMSIPEKDSPVSSEPES